VAQSAAPESRVVCVDHDPVVLVPPGVVQVGAWQQGGAPAAEPGPITAYYVGVGRKP